MKYLRWIWRGMQRADGLRRYAPRSRDGLRRDRLERCGADRVAARIELRRVRWLRRYRIGWTAAALLDVTNVTM